MTIGELRHYTQNRVVRDDNGCWNYVRPQKTGYGRVSHRKKSLMLHRLMYETLVGPIPEGLHIDHLCRNKACCNPAHLEPVTCKENLLRGETHNARNAAKTHCNFGHPFDAENTYISAENKRQCKECKRRRCMERYYRRKAELVLPVAAALAALAGFASWGTGLWQ